MEADGKVGVGKGGEGRESIALSIPTFYFMAPPMADRVVHWGISDFCFRRAIVVIHIRSMGVARGDPGGPGVARGDHRRPQSNDAFFNQVQLIHVLATF